MVLSHSVAYPGADARFRHSPRVSTSDTAGQPPRLRAPFKVTFCELVELSDNQRCAAHAAKKPRSAKAARGPLVQPQLERLFIIADTAA